MKTISFLWHLKEDCMALKLIPWFPICGQYFLEGSHRKNVEKYGKTAVFPGSFDRIGEILHGRLWPDCGLYTLPMTLRTGDLLYANVR